MKNILLICCMLLCSMLAFSQEVFNVNKTTKYRYNFSIKADTFQLQLIDSTQQIINSKQNLHTIKQFTQRDKKTVNQQIYTNKHGQDSIRKWFEKDKLIKAEEFKYDSYNRLSTTSFRDLQNKNNNTDWKYLYRDSIMENGKVTTMMAFRTYAKMFNSLDYTVRTYYNAAGDTLQMIRKDINGEKDIYSKNKVYKRTANTIVYRQETAIKKSELKNQAKLIKQYMLPLKQKLKDPKYISLEYTYATPDSSIQLLIHKNRRENKQTVVITVSEKK